MKALRLAFAVFLFCGVFAAELSAAGLRCAVCKKEIRGRYVKTDDGRVFCSETCFATTAPKCSQCGKPCVKGVYTFGDKKYCSETCRAADMHCSSCGTTKGRFRYVVGPRGETVLLCEACSHKTPCFACGIPRKGSTLPDGRFLCDECGKTVVKTENSLIFLFRQVRNDMKRFYGYDNTHYVKFKLATPQELARLSKDIYLPKGGYRLALMTYGCTVTGRTDRSGKTTYSINKQECAVYVLANVPRELMIDALAHELTHDFLRHKAGKVSDLQMEEGFAEAMAADYNRRRGKADLNLAKENNPDPVYGDGYRKMRDYMAKNGFPATVKLLQSKGIMPIDEVRGRR